MQRNSLLLIQKLKKTLPITTERHLLINDGQRLIAMDIGTSKTGISTSDKAKTIAMPWGLLQHDWDGNMEDKQFKRLRALLLQSSGIIAGYPLHLDGKEGPQCLKTLKILNNWQMNFGKSLPPIYLLDERMSTICIKEGYQDALKIYDTDSLVSLTLLEAFLKERIV